MRLVRRQFKSKIVQLLFTFFFLQYLRNWLEMLDAKFPSENNSKDDGDSKKDIIAILEAPNSNDDKEGKGKFAQVINNVEDNNAIYGIQTEVPYDRPTFEYEKRDPSCENFILARRIDPITIVIPFCNEPLEVLLDVLRSIKDNTWNKLIYEIVFMKGNCKGALPTMEIESALQREYKEVVLVRAGSETSILEGRRKAPIYTSADQIVFVDVYSKFTGDWLRPLLEILALSDTTIAVPMIETFDPMTGSYRVPYNGSVTGFDWYLRPRTLPMPQVYRSRLPSPFPTPVIPSPVFAVKKHFYISLGTHDPGISTWTPAQMELSLKAWLCNGHVVVVPCSRVLMPQQHMDFNYSYKDLLGLKRVVQVWLSVSQRKYVFQRRRDLLSIDSGNLQSSLKLKEDLKCSPPEYYVNNVAMHVTKIFPPEEPRPFAKGKIRSLFRSNTCITARGNEGDQIFITTCTGKENQMWSLDWREQLKNNDDLLCWTTEDIPGDVVVLEECSTADEAPKRQMWIYEPNLGHIRNKGTKRCLSVSESSDLLKQEDCHDGKESHKWKFE